MISLKFHLTLFIVYKQGSDGRLYKFNDAADGWNRTVKKCEQEGAHVAVIDSAGIYY